MDFKTMNRSLRNLKAMGSRRNLSKIIGDKSSERNQASSSNDVVLAFTELVNQSISGHPRFGKKISGRKLKKMPEWQQELHRMFGVLQGFIATARERGDEQLLHVNVTAFVEKLKTDRTQMDDASVKLINSLDNLIQQVNANSIKLHQVQPDVEKIKTENQGQYSIKTIGKQQGKMIKRNSVDADLDSSNRYESDSETYYTDENNDSMHVFDESETINGLEEMEEDQLSQGMDKDSPRNQLDADIRKVIKESTREETVNRVADNDNAQQVSATGLSQAALLSKHRERMHGSRKTAGRDPVSDKSVEQTADMANSNEPIQTLKYP